MSTAWRWAIGTAVGVAACLAIGLVLHLGLGITTSDSSSVVQVLLTIVAILIATRAALYALQSAQAARDAVAPLEQLAQREESVVKALGELLDHIRTEARRQELLDELRVLISIQTATARVEVVKEGYPARDAAAGSVMAAQADLKALRARFPPGRLTERLSDALNSLIGHPVSRPGSAPTENIYIAIEDELTHIHMELAELTNHDSGRA